VKVGHQVSDTLKALNPILPIILPWLEKYCGHFDFVLRTKVYRAKRVKNESEK